MINAKNVTTCVKKKKKLKFFILVFSFLQSGQNHSPLYWASTIITPNHFSLFWLSAVTLHFDQFLFLYYHYPQLMVGSWLLVLLNTIFQSFLGEYQLWWRSHFAVAQYWWMVLQGIFAVQTILFLSIQQNLHIKHRRISAGIELENSVRGKDINTNLFSSCLKKNGESQSSAQLIFACKEYYPFSTAFAFNKTVRRRTHE